MINAPCVIIADFEADNKKCNEKYRGKMHKIYEQKVNSFCYIILWIDTGDVWDPFIYRNENATQEFVKRMDIEIVKINNVLANKVKHIKIEEDISRFNNVNTCWICGRKFIIDRKKLVKMENEYKKLLGIFNNLEAGERRVVLHNKIVKIEKDIEIKKEIAIKVWDHCHITGKF